MSRLALFPAEPVTKLMRGVLYQGVNQSVLETDHSDSLIPRLAVSELYVFSPCVFTWYALRQPYLYHSCVVEVCFWNCGVYIMWNEIGNQPVLNFRASRDVF